MRRRRRGQLVFFSSQLGFIAAPAETDYDACKAFLRLFGEGLRALLWPDNVAVNVIVPGAMESPMMNAVTERAQVPAVPFIIPVSKAVLIMQEGIRRNVAVIAFPSTITAVNSAIGAWPAGIRDMLQTSMTTQHHRQWRMGEVEKYRNKAGKGKQDDYYAKERSAETDKQREEKMAKRDL
jgi:short-subunit dehydrogenase